LNEIKEKFGNCYGEILEDWSGNMDDFAEFNGEVNLKKDPKNHFGFKITQSVGKSIIDKL